MHSHTWYANLGGHLAGLLYGVPHVVTAHSLEPLRPWKAEQLGGGYAVSSFAERTSYLGAAAVIAVSAAMRDDVLHAYPDVDPARVHVVHNGIDTEGWSRVDDPDRVRAHGVDPDRPSVVFVGRITRQKGLPLFLRACRELPPDVQLVLCAGAPDTPEILAEVEGAGRRARRRPARAWSGSARCCRAPTSSRCCPRRRRSSARRSTSRSASSTSRRWPARPRSSRPRPAASPRSSCDGETGLLVPIEQATDGTGTPLDPEQYVADFAAALTSVVSDPDRAAEMGRAGRRRAIESFSWDAIAEQTRQIYDALA